MFNDNRSYIYNKAFYEKFLNEAKSEVQSFYDQLKSRSNSTNGTAYIKTDNRFELIRQWATERGLYEKVILKHSLLSLWKSLAN